MTTRRLAAVLLVSALVCPPAAEKFVAAQSAGEVPARRPGTDTPVRATATIVGYIWSADSSPIPSATLRLRNVVSGDVAVTASSNESGRFTFADVDEGTYVVEYVDANGNVLAVGSPFAVAAGETVSTFLRLGSRGPFGGFFTTAAAAVVASAASIGVTAVVPTGRPVSPNR
jgi:Carboxypeptidase regulatory-like domain